MTAVASAAAPRRRRRTGALAGTALLLCCACGVPRTVEPPRTAPDELPRLRRASQALRERITTEKQHVEAFNVELEQLRAREGALYGEVLDAEETYQRLQADVDALHRDLAVAQGDLDASHARLAETRAAVETARAELAATELEVGRVRASAEAAQGEIRFWMAEEDVAAATLADLRETLERFRGRWRIPAEPWAALFGELGLWHLVAPAPAGMVPVRAARPPFLVPPRPGRAEAGGPEAASEAPPPVAPPPDGG